MHLNIFLIFMLFNMRLNKIDAAIVKQSMPTEVQQCSGDCSALQNVKPVFVFLSETPYQKCSLTCPNSINCSSLISSTTVIYSYKSKYNFQNSSSSFYYPSYDNNTNSLSNTLYIYSLGNYIPVRTDFFC